MVTFHYNPVPLHEATFPAIFNTMLMRALRSKLWEKSKHELYTLQYILNCNIKSTPVECFAETKVNWLITSHLFDVFILHSVQWAHLLDLHVELDYTTST